MLRPELDVRDAALSPDGDLLAYVSAEAGRPELFVRPLAGGEVVRVSEGGAWSARFAPDGRTLYFVTLDRRLASVSVAPPPGLSLGSPELRFPVQGLGWTDFDVLSDGTFLALVKETDGMRSPLTVLLGWTGRLDGGAGSAALSGGRARARPPRLQDRT